jgi:CPA2 family monovalent cation:H+ antiporter-2
MAGSHANTVLQDLGLTLAVSAVTGLATKRLGQPSIVGYLLAGLVVGPHVPIPLFADVDRVQTLAELGVVLVMFAVGLEFRVSRLLQVLPRAGVVAVVQIGAMALLGGAAGALFGLSWVEQTLLGSAVAISSTMVVSKVFESARVEREPRDLVFGVLVVQDVVAVVLLAVMSAVVAGAGLTPEDVGVVVLELLASLAGLGILGLLVIPAAFRRIVADGGQELVVVAAGAVGFGAAAGAAAMGYSPALGAFLGGVLVAESGTGAEVEHAVRPLRDLFAAVFFVSIGMLVDPIVALRDLPAIGFLSGLVIGGQLATVSIAAVLAGHSLRTGIVAGLSLGQVGEFGFLLAALGAGAGAGPRLIAILVGVALVTTFTTAWAIRSADRVVHLMDARIPRRLQRLLGWYEAWFRRPRSAVAPVVAHVRRLSAHMASLTGLLVCTALAEPAVTGRLSAAGAPPWAAPLALPLAALVVAAPLGAGAVWAMKALADHLANELVPGDRAGTEAARRLVRANIRLLVALGSLLPSAAIVRPFLGAWAAGTAVAVLVVVGAAVLVWRRAGEVVPESLTAAGELARLLGPEPAATTPPSEPPLVLEPGIVCLRLTEGARAVGRTLAELDLRAVTGASVIVVARAGGEVVSPSGHERLAAHDLLGLVGAQEAIERARSVLLGPEPSP